MSNVITYTRGPLCVSMCHLLCSVPRSYKMHYIIVYTFIHKFYTVSKMQTHLRICSTSGMQCA